VFSLVVTWFRWPKHRRNAGKRPRERRPEQGRRPRNQPDGRLPRPLRPAPKRHLSTSRPLLAAPVVRNRNLPRTRRSPRRLVLLVDPAPRNLVLLDLRAERESRFQFRPFGVKGPSRGEALVSRTGRNQG
jgi:hypothetical protein